MKNIKIFLVPSSNAVMGDMTGVRDFFRQLNEMYFDSGINFSILNANEMTENELNEHVADSDLSFFLFFEGRRGLELWPCAPGAAAETGRLPEASPPTASSHSQTGP